MNATPFKPSAAQQTYFDWIKSGSGSAILEAVAGSGKTTTILQGSRFMTGRIIYFAFNKKIADELKSRLIEMEVQNAEASTLHAFGYRALRFAFKGKQLKPNASKMADIWETQWANVAEQMAPLKSAVIKTASMAKQRGLGALTAGSSEEWATMIDHYDLLNSAPEGVEPDEIISLAQQLLKRSNEILDIIDFDDMIYLPLLFKLRTLQYDWVGLDEAQDTNPTRRALVAKAMRPGGRLVAVGDPHQAIYGFTGADNNALDQIVEQFACIRLPLTVSYRCPQAVVLHAQNWVSHIRAHDSAPMGEVTTSEYDTALQNAAPRDAFLCRYNKYLVQACFKLIRMGKGAKIEGREIGQGLIAITKKWKVRKLDALLDRVQSWEEREVQKAIAKKREDKADRVQDQAATLYVLIQRTQEQGGTTIDDLQKTINELFDDNVGDKGLITLCSVHKSKGMEWDNVHILGREQFMPSKMARQPWQQEQEINLIYVAVTRAKTRLVEVSMPIKPE